MDSSKKKIVLRASDGELFEVSETVAVQSETIKHMIEDDCAGDAIPLPNITSNVLAKVIEYCSRHVDTPDYDNSDSDEDLKNWDKEFLKVDQAMLFDIMLASNYLNIKSLLDLTCEDVAEQLKGKTAQEQRAHFHIINDYTPEEEEEVRRENAWAFE